MLHTQETGNIINPINAFICLSASPKSLFLHGRTNQVNKEAFLGQTIAGHQREIYERDEQTEKTKPMLLYNAFIIPTNISLAVHIFVVVMLIPL